MGYLLDTHTILWMLLEPEKLSAETHKVLLNNDVDIYYSPISLWEIAIKYSIGKLNLHGVTPDDVMAALDEEPFDCLDVFPGIWAQSYQLPRLHSDPFDHLLVWEALTNDLTFLSADKKLRAYESEGLRIIA
ncbi:MAG: type II toxin-antitoxin system VapC family toxin [Coriobacteriia bacterium]|nr:type II toxin-antitoxin system VapC family toxin [Coriobacteriia bacterium]